MMKSLTVLGGIAVELELARPDIQEGGCVLLERGGATIFPIVDQVTGGIANVGFYIGKEGADENIESDWLFVPVSVPEGATGEETSKILCSAIVNAIETVKKRGQ